MVHQAAIAVLDYLLQKCQRSSPRLGVHIRSVETHRTGPSGHLHGERDEQEHTPHQSGVEQVLPQAAEGHLGNADSHQRTNHYYPPRQVARQVERQQQTREDSRAVTDSGLLLEQELGYQPLEQHAGCHADGCGDERAPTECHHAYHVGGHQSRNHQEHIFPDTVAAVRMRCRRYD